MHFKFGMNRLVKTGRNTEKQLFVWRSWNCSGEICGQGQKGKSVLFRSEFRLLVLDFYLGRIRIRPH